MRAIPVRTKKCLCYNKNLDNMLKMMYNNKEILGIFNKRFKPWTFDYGRLETANGMNFLRPDPK